MNAQVVRRMPSGDRPAQRAAAERLSRNPRDPDALFARAAFLAAHGHLREADEALRALAEIDPEYPGLWRFRAWLYNVLGRLWLAALCEARDAEEESELS